MVNKEVGGGIVTLGLICSISCPIQLCFAADSGELSPFVAWSRAARQLSRSNRLSLLVIQLQTNAPEMDPSSGKIIKEDAAVWPRAGQ